MNDLISVIVPIYNVEKYLKKCIESLINQTYDNLEIILVDDGSPDGCGKICDEYALMDGRIHVIHKENGGLSDARNAGIDFAKGQYFMFVDSDDYINVNMVKSLYDAILFFQADLAICRYKNVFDDEIMDYTGACNENDAFVITKEDYLSTYEYYHDRKSEFIVAWNKLYSRRLFDDVRYPKGKVHEDEFTTYKLIYKASKMVYIPHELYYYVQRKNSIMSHGITRKRLLVLDAIAERLAFYEDRKEMGYWKRDFENFRISYLKYLGAVSASKDLSVKDFKKYKKIFRNNMVKYFSVNRCLDKNSLKVFITGACPLAYAKLLRKIH